jgi:outer membrane biosynthesis protein TonB
MTAKPITLQEISVLRRFLPGMGFISAVVLAMAPLAAHGQVNIDQGKPPSEIFATDCAVCHKTTKGLANGKNSLMLSSFLREHYTASREQAAALAAYVLGAGGNAPAPKPGQEHAKIEEPKPGPHAPSAKLEEEKPATAKPARPTTDTGRKPEPAEANPPAQEPAPVAAAPAANVPAQPETPPPPHEAAPTTSAAAPPETQPDENASVPRDNIPD